MKPGEEIPALVMATSCRLCDVAITKPIGTKPRELVCGPCGKALEEDRRAREELRCAVCARRDDSAEPLCNGCRLRAVAGLRARLRRIGPLGEVLGRLLDTPAVRERLARTLGRSLAGFVDPAERHDC